MSIPVNSNLLRIFGSGLVRLALSKSGIFLNEKIATPMPVPPLASEPVQKILAQLADSLGQPPHKGLDSQKGPLAKLFLSLSLNAEKDFSPVNLKKNIQDSGLMWEQKLKAALALPNVSKSAPDLIRSDMKGLSLQLLGSATGQAPAMSERISLFVDALQLLQFANVLSYEENGKFFLFIPFLHEKEVHFVQFLADLSKHSGRGGPGGDRLLKVSLCLELSELGPIRADAALFGKDIRAAFTASNKDTAKFLQSRANKLKETFINHGFKLSHISCCVKKASILQNMNLADELFKPSDSGLDLVI